MVIKLGVVDTLSSFAEIHSTPTRSQKGGPFRTLLRRGTVRPKNVAKKKKKVCACSA